MNIKKAREKTRRTTSVRQGYWIAKKVEILSLRVTLKDNKKVYREIEVLPDQTFQDLHRVIVRSFNFDDDHLYAFFLDNWSWSKNAIYSASYEDKEAKKVRHADKERISGLNWGQKRKILYLFDFGDEWCFEVEYLGKKTVKNAINYPRIVKKIGKSPKQY